MDGGDYVRNNELLLLLFLLSLLDVEWLGQELEDDGGASDRNKTILSTSIAAV